MTVNQLSHVGALVEGRQSVEVAATTKHFTGRRNSSIDSHYGSPVLDHSRSKIRERELVLSTTVIAASVCSTMTDMSLFPRSRVPQTSPVRCHSR